MDVAADLEQIVVFIDQQGLVTLRKDVPTSAVAFVKGDRVARLKGLHHLGEIALGGLHQQVNVVA